MAPTETARERRSRATAPALQALAAVLLCAAATAQQPAEEVRIKAAFVAKFAEFTEWPGTALGARTTIEFCVAQSDAFHLELAELIRGESLWGRPLATRAVHDASEIGTCHLLFVPTLPHAARKRYLLRAEALPVLTVSDAPGFLDDGGIVQLRMADRRVRFDVNIDAAIRVNLRLQSQLLRLARQVRGGSS